MGLLTSYKKATDQTVEKENDSIGHQVIGLLSAPVRFKDDVLVTEKAQAVAVWTYSLLSFFGGELVGHIRASKGGQAFVPIGRP